MLLFYYWPASSSRQRCVLSDTSVNSPVVSRSQTFDLRHLVWPCLEFILAKRLSGQHVKWSFCFTSYLEEGLFEIGCSKTGTSGVERWIQIMTQYSSIKTVQKLANKTAENVFHRFNLVITEEESNGLQCFLLLVIVFKTLHFLHFANIKICLTSVYRP